MAFLRLSDAINFACEKHYGSYRDGEAALPYVTHPIDVVNNLRYVGLLVEEDLLIAGALHDVLEETQTSAAEICEHFGPLVSSLVQQVTRFEPDISGLTKEQAWELRSATLLREIAEMGTEAMTIKLADRLSNLRQAKVTRKPLKLERYKRQTEKILEIIPKTVNLGLWNAIRAELG